MKFKMAPNSLFAVLLRSPWWISIGIALAIVAAAQALLPVEYRVVGSLGAFPLTGIGLVALWRQMRAPSAKRVQVVSQALGTMSWPEFSKALEQAFTQDGFAVERLQGAADLSIARAGRTTLVSAKRWKAARQGEEGLQGLHAAAQARDASGCMSIALGEFSPNAERFAKANGIELIQGDKLARLLAKVKLNGG